MFPFMPRAVLIDCASGIYCQLMMGQKGQLGSVDTFVHMKLMWCLQGALRGITSVGGAVLRALRQQVGWGRRRFYVPRWNLNIFEIIVFATEGKMS